MDSAGNVYLADRVNSTIRMISAAGSVTTIAGLPNSPGSADGTNCSARFSNPSGVVLDGTTNLYVADTGNHTIRKITPAGVVTTFAGYAGANGTADGVGTNARFYAPLALTLDGQGDLLVSDTGNSTIRKITPAQVVSTLAGVPGFVGSLDASTSNSLFGAPAGIAMDSASNIYVADSGYAAIRRIAPNGTVSTLAGLAGTTGSVDGTGSAARFGEPYGLTVDGSGNVVVADLANNELRLVTPQGMVSTLAGGLGTAGSSDGVGTAALFSSPQFVALDTNGYYYVTDGGNYSVRTSRPPPPTLQITFAANYAVLSWPNSAGGYILEANNTPFSNGAWVPLTNLAIVSVGTNYRASNLISSSNLFYRLHKQP